MAAGTSLGAARNAGLGAVDADYIVCVDADDWIEPELIEIEANYLDDHPELDCVWCDVTEAREVDHDRERRITTFRLEARPQAALHLACGAMYRRSCWESIGGYADRTRGDSVDFWLRFGQAGFSAHRIATPLYFYRQHGSNMHNDPI